MGRCCSAHLGTCSHETETEDVMTTGNDGLRVVLDLRGGKFWWTLNERGEQHESGRGYSTLHECVEHCELYRRMLKPVAR